MRGTDPVSARRTFKAACAALAQAVEDGACGGWGISAWDTATPALIVSGSSLEARPDVLMIRAGLTVSARHLRASRDLIRALRPNAAWGMSPFGGAPQDPLWNIIDARDFIQDGTAHDRYQAAFRVAAELPQVELVVTGTRDHEHLRQLSMASTLRVNSAMIGRYTTLLESRALIPVDATHPG